MKITCSYCGAEYKDTLEQCPGCGGSNPNAKRKFKGKPRTIEQLQQWYINKNLPSPEVTRFFIGEDVRVPKAFGIYRDDFTGNVIVYKNKDDGQRTVRYEGRDEEHAVNELRRRLEQEMTEQEQRLRYSRTIFRHPDTWGYNNARWIRKVNPIALFGSMFFILFGIIAGMLFFLRDDTSDPEIGYYSYKNAIYYNNSSPYTTGTWFSINEGDEDWTYIGGKHDLPVILWDNKNCKKYYLGETWENNMPCPDFKESVYCRDMELGVDTEEGYFLFDDEYYFHFEGYCYCYWYHYNGEYWDKLFDEDVPYMLKHSSLNEEYYKSKDYQTDFTCPNFADSIEYVDFHTPKIIKTGYFKVGEDVYYHNKDLYNTGWYIFDEQSWKYVAYNQLPEELYHVSVVEAYYYTPEWDDNTPFTKFEETDFYKSESAENNDNSTDNSYHHHHTTWNNSGTDWGSDW